jgi:hypothetical protein
VNWRLSNTFCCSRHGKLAGNSIVVILRQLSAPQCLKCEVNIVKSKIFDSPITSYQPTSFKQKEAQRAISFLIKVEQQISFEHEPPLVKLHFSLEVQKTLNMRKEKKTKKEIKSEEMEFL